MSEEKKIVELKEENLKNVTGGGSTGKKIWYSQGMPCPHVDKNGKKCNGTLDFLEIDPAAPTGPIERYRCNVCGLYFQNVNNLR